MSSFDKGDTSEGAAYIADRRAEFLNARPVRRQPMLDATYEIREIRFVIEPDFTEAYVLCSTPSDGTLGIQGWHKATFPKYVSVQNILNDDIKTAKYLTDKRWSWGAPPVHRALLHQTGNVG